MNKRLKSNFVQIGNTKAFVIATFPVLIYTLSGVWMTRSFFVLNYQGNGVVSKAFGE